LIAQPPRADHRADSRYAGHLCVVASAAPVGLLASFALAPIRRALTPLGARMSFVFGEQCERARDPPNFLTQPAQLRRRILLGLGQAEQAEKRTRGAARTRANRGSIQLAPVTMSLT